jgi:hypothetical protein
MADEKEDAGATDGGRAAAAPESPAGEMTRKMSEKMGAFLTMSLCGILCGIMMWIAFAWVAKTATVEDFVGATIGGWISGVAMYALS